MAVLFRSKFPSESVYIPKEHRFISFSSGEYATEDAEEIAVLSPMYNHDGVELEPPEPEKKKPGRKPKVVEDA